MNNNLQSERCFFVLYPETNRCQKKFFRSGATCAEEAAKVKHFRPSQTQTANSSQNQEMQMMQFIPFELPF